MAKPPLHASLDLLGGPTSPAAARRFARHVLDEWGGYPTDTSALLITEVTTNALLHARGPITIRLRVEGLTLHVEVQDTSPVLPRPRPAALDATTGRGLLLLDRLSKKWGSQPLPDAGPADVPGKVVWFDLLLDESDSENSPDVDLDFTIDIDRVEPI
jgi:hypothetical protein